jgi:hypothetical protein
MSSNEIIVFTVTAHCSEPAKIILVVVRHSNMRLQCANPVPEYCILLTRLVNNFIVRMGKTRSIQFRYISSWHLTATLLLHQFSA